MEQTLPLTHTAALKLLQGISSVAHCALNQILPTHSRHIVPAWAVHN